MITEPLDRVPRLAHRHGRRGLRLERRDIVGDAELNTRALVALQAALDAANALNLTQFGRASVQRLLRGAHLRHIELQRHHLSDAETAVGSPLVVIGLPRTGSTLLHELLSLGPDVIVPRSWMLASFRDRPAGPRWRSPRSYLASATMHTTLNLISRRFSAVHPHGPNEPEECVLILGQGTFEGWTFAGSLAPSYGDFLLERDMTATYAEHRRVLAFLDTARHGRRWVLKCPHHLFDLEALAATYPGAQFVWLHRNPTDVFPSWCGLSEAVMQMSTDRIDRTEIGRSWLKWWSIGVDRAMAWRSRHDATVLDVAYDELLSNPVGVVSRICSWANLTPPDASNVSMAASPRRKRHNPYRYTLEEFGLTKDDIHGRFSAYESAFGWQ